MNPRKAAESGLDLAQFKPFGRLHNEWVKVQHSQRIDFYRVESVLFCTSNHCRDTTVYNWSVADSGWALHYGVVLVACLHSQSAKPCKAFHSFPMTFQQDSARFSGTELDVPQAMQYMEKAALQGHAEAQCFDAISNMFVVRWISHSQVIGFCPTCWSVLNRQTPLIWKSSQALTKKTKNLPRFGATPSLSWDLASSVAMAWNEMSRRLFPSFAGLQSKKLLNWKKLFYRFLQRGVGTRSLSVLLLEAVGFEDFGVPKILACKILKSQLRSSLNTTCK